jgi:hypothetical protein
MKNIPGGHNLFVQDQGVSKLIENVYSKVRSQNSITWTKKEAKYNIIASQIDSCSPKNLIVIYFDSKDY